MVEDLIEEMHGSSIVRLNCIAKSSREKEETTQHRQKTGRPTGRPV
jgi:hypothetical protein